MERMLLAVLAASLVVPVSAQTRPNVSGIWAFDPARSESPVEGDGAGPTFLIIRQSETEVSVEARRPTRTDVMVFPFEGAKRPTVSAPEGVADAKSSWDGDRLATEAVYHVHGQAVTARQFFSLSPTGTELTVETVIEVQHGYGLREGKNYGTATDVFRKVSP